MGNCVSVPPNASTVEAARSVGKDGLKPVERVSIEPPVKVFRDGQEAAVTLQSTRSGRLTLGVSKEQQTSEETARLLQETFQGQDAKKHLDNLALLSEMGLEVRYSSSNPFIGKLQVKVLELKGSTHPKNTYVKARCEDDKSDKSTGVGSGEEPDTVVFDNAIFIFIIVHSNAVLQLKAKDTRGSLYGKVDMPVSSLAQGTSVGTFDLTDMRESSKVIGSIKAEVSYTWLRGTRDDGAYQGASRVVINKRKLRQHAGIAGPKSALEFISQVNHSVLSHDNIYSSKPLEGEKEEEDEDMDTAQSSPTTGPRTGVLSTRSASLRHLSASQRWKQAIDRARRGESDAAAGGSKAMQEATLLEALGPKEGESEEISALKEQMFALLLALSERVEAVEAVQDECTAAIQELVSKAEPSSATLSISKVQAPVISGTFEYGLGRPAAKRKVYLFINKAQDQRALTPAMVQFLGVYKTDVQGKLKGVAVPETVWQTPGVYNVVGLLPEDNTFAKGSLFVLTPGSKCVVFDMDGTLTVGDKEVVTVFAIDSLAGSTKLAAATSHQYDVKARNHALMAVRAWAAKGYQPIYLSGRQGSYYNLTLEWLIKHRYPPGPIHLTRTHMPTLPFYYSVGNFKVDYMTDKLTRQGIEIYAAYGNTPTDIRAYGAVGIPKERTFIIGPHGGKAGTVRLERFTPHLRDIFDFPDAELPVPNTELLFTANPGYKKRVRVKGPDGLVRELSTVSSTLSDVVDDDDDDDDDDDTATGGAGPELQVIRESSVPEGEEEAVAEVVAAARQNGKGVAVMDMPEHEHGQKEEKQPNRA